MNALDLPAAAAPPLEDLEGDALALFQFSDVPAPRGHLGTVDWYLCGAVSRLQASGRFTALPGTAALLTSRDKFRVGRILVFGLGPRQGMSPVPLKDDERSQAMFYATFSSASTLFTPTVASSAATS